MTGHDFLFLLPSEQVLVQTTQPHNCLDDPKRSLSVEYSDENHNNFQYIHLSFESESICNQYKAILTKLNNARNNLRARLFTFCKKRLYFHTLMMIL